MSESNHPSEPVQQNRPWRIQVADRMNRLPHLSLARINRLMYEKRRAGDDVIDLGMGNPGDPPEPLIIDKLAEAARDPKTHRYSEAQGLLNLRREVGSKYFKRYGVRLDPEREVVVCLGSKEGFSHLCLALLGPGDTAIVPAPSYPAHLYAVALASANSILLEVTDADWLLSNIAYTCQHMVPRPKLAIVNFPHNPTTATVEPDFYVELVRAGQAIRLHGHQRSGVCRRDVRRLRHAELSGHARRGRRRRRTDHDEQGLQHGRLARRLLCRQRRDRPRLVDDQMLLRLRHVRADPDRKHHGSQALRRGGRGPGGDLPAPPRRPLRRARAARLADHAAEGDDVRLAKVPEPYAGEMTRWISP